MTTRAERVRRGFTMIELIVVVVILAVAAGAIVPRAMSTPARTAERAALQIRDLLSAAASRAALTSQRILVDYSAQAERMMVWSMTPTSEALGDASDFSAKFEWREETLISPVDTEGLEVVSAWLGQAPLDAKAFRVELSSDTPREALTIVLSRAGQASAWRLELDGPATSATFRRTTRDDAAPTRTRRLDLDENGMAEAPW